MGKRMNWDRARKQSADTTTKRQRALDGQASALIERAQARGAAAWGAARHPAPLSRYRRPRDSSHLEMVITDGMLADGTLRVLTGDAARRAWREPIRGRGA
jgi:hypothetical protein